MVFIFILTSFLYHEQLTPDTIDDIVSAIEVVENSSQFPYGIKSVPIKGKTKKERWNYARKICINSIQNNFERWNDAGKPEDFFKFMNRRFCPLDMNWHKNLSAVLRKKNFDFNQVQ